MKWLTPGEYNKKITIQYIACTVTDERGDPVPQWCDLFSDIWANVSINSGREFWASRQVNAEWDGLFKIRWSVNRRVIDNTMRILYDNRIFDIKTPINPDEANREIWLEAREVV